LSLALFVITNMETFTPNSDIHTKNAINKSNLYLPQTRLTSIKKDVYFSGIKKLSSDTNIFKGKLKKFLLMGSFYSIEEFFGWTSIRNLYALYL
jgi:hypothetical protein